MKMQQPGLLREGEILLGKYHIGPKVGEGGMAVVYHAVSRGAAGFERPVVIKAIKATLATNPQMNRQFIREASVGAELQHPNIVQVFDLGERNGVLYMVLEYVAGKDLAALAFRARRARRVLSPELVAFIMIDVCKALEASHEHLDVEGQPRPIIHRDISPQNILLSRDGHVKLADFGMARAIGATRHTAFGVIKGKLSYMSPEQSRGGEIDARSDLFCLGIVLWETLTGRRLFLANDAQETIRRVRACEVPPIVQAAPHVSPELGVIVHKALQPGLEERYQTATELRKALQNYLRGARVVGPGVLTAVLETYFPPGDEAVEVAEPSLSYVDRRDLDEDEDPTTRDDDFAPSLDNEPPDSPAMKHTLIMFGDDGKNLQDELLEAKRIATAKVAETLIGQPGIEDSDATPTLRDPPHSPLPASATEPFDEEQLFPSADAASGKPTKEEPSWKRSPEGKSTGRPDRGGKARKSSGKRKKRSPYAPFIISLLIGVPLGVSVGFLVFWLLTR